MKDPNQAIRGRGASGNPANRFDNIAYEREPELEDDEPRPSTVFLPDGSKTIVARNDSPDVGFSASINPYRGCEHGCIYCYARPTHEYLGFSAGLDFESRIMVKEDAPALLRKELSSPRWKPEVLSISGVTDAYQPVERQRQLTRRCLEVLAEFRNPCGIVTKNRLVTRDIDILREMAGHNGAMVYLSLPTLDVSLNRVMEPRTSLPAQRLAAIEALAAAGIPVGVLVAPVIPGLTDHEIPSVLEAAAQAGARFTGYVMLRLPHAVAPLFENWLDQHYPDRKDKILNRVRAMRGGSLNVTEYGTRMRGEGLFADQIRSLFAVAARKSSYGPAPELSTTAFRRSPAGGQLGLFD